MKACQSATGHKWLHVHGPGHVHFQPSIEHDPKNAGHGTQLFWTHALNSRAGKGASVLQRSFADVFWPRGDRTSTHPCHTMVCMRSWMRADGSRCAGTRSRLCTRPSRNLTTWTPRC